MGWHGHLSDRPSPGGPALAGIAFGLALVVVGALLGLTAQLLIRRRKLGSSAHLVTLNTLHTATLATPGLREGLTGPGAQRAVRHLRSLLGTDALAPD